MNHLSALVSCSLLVVSAPALAQSSAAPASVANAQLKTADGKDVGTATLMHAVGKCEAPGFTSAGPHFNPGNKKHGKLNPDGHHAGDMDDITIPANGNLSLTIVNKDITLDKGKPNSVFQAAGTALVVHAKEDDYKTDPAGNAGDRIACGVVTEGPAKTQ